MEHFFSFFFPANSCDVGHAPCEYSPIREHRSFLQNGDGLAVDLRKNRKDMAHVKLRTRAKQVCRFFTPDEGKV